MKIVVVGGGAAGLAALHTLRRAGADAVCLEASDRPGGRLASVKRDGFILDIGAQFFFRYYDTAFNLCREIGLGGDIARFPFRAALPDMRHGGLTPVQVSIRLPDLPVVLRDLISFRGVSLKSLRQFLPILPVLIAKNKKLRFTTPEKTLDLDGESFSGYVLRKGGSEVLERILQPIATCMTVGEPEDMGAGYGLALFWHLINGLWTLKNGIGSVTGRLHEMYRDRIVSGTPVKRIVLEKGAVKGVETGAGLIDADAVICAVSATQALLIMPDLPDTMAGPLRTARYSRCCHVILGIEERVFPRGWYAVALPRRTGSVLAGFTDSSVKSPFYAPRGAGLVHCFTFGRHSRELNAMSDRDVIKAVVSEVRNFIPAMPDRHIFSEIYRFDEAVCLSPPGMLKAMDDLRKKNYRDVRGLALAGEYMYMPSVNGAMQSGIDAAVSLLK